MTQLLCRECMTDLLTRLRGQSVERTPQNELDDLSKGAPDDHGS